MSSTAQGSLRVLIVDDHEPDRRLVSLMLQDQAGDYDVRGAETLAEGISTATTSAFDVMLLDLGLPDEDGLDVVRQAHFSVPGTPIVVLTGLQEEAMGLAALQEGAQDYLIKAEMTGAGLSAAVRHAIERYRLVGDVQDVLQLLSEARERQSNERLVRLVESSLEVMVKLADQVIAVGGRATEPGRLILDEASSLSKKLRLETSPLADKGYDE